MWLCTGTVELKVKAGVCVHEGKGDSESKGRSSVYLCMRDKGRVKGRSIVYVCKRAKGTVKVKGGYL